MKNLYVFGNPYLDEDNFALKVADKIKKEVKIIHCSSPEMLLDAKGKELLIMDVVKNMKRPRIIKNVDDLKTGSITSLHDFDVGFFLRLMQEAGIGKKIKIIGVPSKGNAEKISKEVAKWV